MRSTITALRRNFLSAMSRRRYAKPLNQVELTPEIFERIWPLSDVTIGRVLQQHTNRMVREIFSAEGRFVFKIAGYYRNAQEFERAVGIFDFLEERNFSHIPVLLKSRKQKTYKIFDGNFGYLMEYVDGEKFNNSIQQWHRLGITIATLHDIAGYPYRSSYTISAVFKELYQNALVLPFGREYLKIVKTIQNFESASESLLHTDVGPNNVIQRDDGELVLIDWDDPGRGKTVIDLGFPLILHFVTYDQIFEHEKASAFYDGYFSKRSLSAADRDLIFDAGLLCALAYLPSGDIDKNWERILFAVSSRQLITSVLC